jgi:hypothetical protein
LAVGRFQKKLSGTPRPAPETIMELTRDGKVVRGVILEPKDNTAIGVIHLTSHRGLRAVRNTFMANTATAVTSGQLDDVYAAMTSRLQVTTGALPILKANGDTSSTTKGPVMKKRIASKKTGTADGGDKDSDSEFNLDVILGKTELRVCGGGKADTGNCKTEQPDDQKKPSKKRSATTTAPSSTPRTKKVVATTSQSGGNATVKANKEMDAADLLVAANGTKIKFAENLPWWVI